MFSSENLLGLPQKQFEYAGIHIGNLISKELAKHSKEYKAQYNYISNKITILNTSDLPPSILNKMLYTISASREYDVGMWYPIVEKERNKEGNLELKFSCLKPGEDNSRSHFKNFIQPLPMEFGSGFISELASLRSNFKLPTLDIDEEEVLDNEEVTLMEKSVSEGIIKAMSQFFNKHEMTGGIWYPNDYRKYLMDEFDKEMDETFYTGFANEKFFEKTGRFNFVLKEGEKASEALLSFLEGPTVADCGNATVACYYKCILDIIGEEKFNALFSSKHFLLTIGQKGILDAYSPISYFADFSEASKTTAKGRFGKRPLKIGEECYFQGIIWYPNKHPEEFGGGWNVIYIGDNQDREQLFLAHGFEKALTETEINQKLVELYNRERTPKDEQYVIQAKKPTIYDKETNGYLVSHYTISDREIAENPSKFIKGFAVGSVKGLQISELIKLKNAENIDQFILNLKTKKKITEYIIL